MSTENDARKSPVDRFDIDRDYCLAILRFVFRKTESEPIWKNGKLSSKYRCPSCSNYLRFPVQFDSCGDHICSSCLPDVLR